MRFVNCLMANVALHANSVIAARLAAGRAKKKRGASFASAIPLKRVLKPQMTVLNWAIGKQIPLQARQVLPA